jgi:hypothetical protein
VKEVRKAHPNVSVVVELWAEDEMRVGLKPVFEEGLGTVREEASGLF